MESDESQLKGAGPSEWFFMKAKVALAVAIIKNKPAGMSGRQYAEALACKLQSQDESWKNKAKGLQQEVLRLRQEMLITRVTSNTTSTTKAAGHDDTIEDVSQDLFDPGTEVHSADLQQGSDSETPDLLQHDLQPDIIFPPPLFPSSHHADPRGKAILPHMQFLQSLCALHRVGGSDRDLQSLWLGPDGEAGSVLVDTVCQLLDSVVAASRDPPLLGPCDLILKACQVAARAMDLFCSQRLPSVEFMRRVEESLRELTGMLLHSNQPSRAGCFDSGSKRQSSSGSSLRLCVLAARLYAEEDPLVILSSSSLKPAVSSSSLAWLVQFYLSWCGHCIQYSSTWRALAQDVKLRAAERLMECLITLGSSSMSKALLIRHILSQISALADQLWQAFQAQESSGLDKFPADQYQNSCHLFWIVEELLQKSKVPCRVEVGSEQTGFLSHLEQHVFLLSDEFPLFSIYMWRIGSLLTSSDK